MNILVIGNGFDLAHKLPTRYNDFLGFVERFLNIINTPQILQQGELKNTEKTVYKYIDHLIFNEQQLCKELEQLVKDNIWIEYFLQNPMYQKENWIDFNAGRMVEDKSKEELAQDLFNYVLAVASGKKVKAEEAGFHDMAIFKQGVTL